MTDSVCTPPPSTAAVDRPAHAAQEPVHLAAADSSFTGRAGIDLGQPEGLIGQQVADAGDGLLIKQSGLDWRRSAREDRPELGRRDFAGVGAEVVHRRVEADPAEPARVDQEQRATVGEASARTGVNR